MTRKRSTKSAKPLREQNLLKPDDNVAPKVDRDDDVVGLESSASSIDGPQPGTSSAADNLSSDAAALYDELDSFRQRWKRELESNKKIHDPPLEYHHGSNTSGNVDTKENESPDTGSGATSNSSLKESFSLASENHNDPKQIYALAKKLFLIGVDLEQDEMHHESIRYYKQAMHLCPDIEKRIFREQCEASAQISAKTAKTGDPSLKDIPDSVSEVENATEERLPLIDRIRENYYNDYKDKKFTYCKPAVKIKQDALHISNLPHELLLHICRRVIGQELDLASLEAMGMVCRGFYLLSREESIWRSVCYSVWGDAIHSECGKPAQGSRVKSDTFDWRQLYIERPRVNFDGVYISRTRYIRQGDVGFQDITYRPFHVIRYYRYLRFFPDRRVLILTTNEEPEKIVPIFRHALHTKQFSSELSILEGHYEFIDSNQITIVADKECRLAPPQPVVQTRRQAQFQWSRQTPMAQRFNFRFELRTAENKPYRNNVLKWLDYFIQTTWETGQEVTSFDLSPDTFPSLIFSRVKRFNLRSAQPLSSH